MMIQVMYLLAIASHQSNKTPTYDLLICLLYYIL